MEICSVEGCSAAAVCRGWCNPHYQRWYKYGDASRPVRIHGDDDARFWSKVDKDGPGGCWLWMPPVNPRTGYGQVRMGGRDGKYVLVHRWAYARLVGPIAPGRQLDHLCRVRNCVNPAHLEPVTARVNTMRGSGPSALNSTKSHCKHGHEFTPENTYVTKSGDRACRECARAATRAWRAGRGR